MIGMKNWTKYVKISPIWIPENTDFGPYWHSLLKIVLQ